MPPPAPERRRLVGENSWTTLLVRTKNQFGSPDNYFEDGMNEVMMFWPLMEHPNWEGELPLTEDPDWERTAVLFRYLVNELYPGPLQFRGRDGIKYLLGEFPFQKGLDEHDPIPMAALPPSEQEHDHGQHEAFLQKFTDHIKQSYMKQNRKLEGDPIGTSAEASFLRSFDPTRLVSSRELGFKESLKWIRACQNVGGDEWTYPLNRSVNGPIHSVIHRQYDHLMKVWGGDAGVPIKQVMVMDTGGRPDEDPYNTNRSWFITHVKGLQLSGRDIMEAIRRDVFFTSFHPEPVKWITALMKEPYASYLPREFHERTDEIIHIVGERGGGQEFAAPPATVVPMGGHLRVQKQHQAMDAFSDTLYDHETPLLKRGLTGKGALDALDRIREHLENTDYGPAGGKLIAEIIPARAKVNNVRSRVKSNIHIVREIENKLYQLEAVGDSTFAALFEATILLKNTEYGVTTLPGPTTGASILFTEAYLYQVWEPAYQQAVREFGTAPEYEDVGTGYKNIQQFYTKLFVDERGSKSKDGRIKELLKSWREFRANGQFRAYDPQKRQGMQFFERDFITHLKDALLNHQDSVVAALDVKQTS